ncbi:MAG: hypothetical protein LBK06_07755 [Planctomycetaceae bacterium]|jgi:hypothetical protein|nr:hypothetical protein [Planctomycetaceae bacterium]
MRKINALVVDACIARATSEKPVTLRAFTCTSFLNLMMRDKHYFAVFSEQLQTEWLKHKSHHATKWLSTMIARKRIRYVSVTRAELREKVIATSQTDKEKEAMTKDFHLIEAALSSDKAIVSCDENVHQLFQSAAQNVGEIRIILWYNPEANDQWLENGAPVEKERQLGYSI